MGDSRSNRVSATTECDLYSNADPSAQSLWHPTPAGEQFAYLADNVGATVLRQDLATPLTSASGYILSFLQSGFRVPRGYAVEITIALSPTGSTGTVFNQTFALPDGADWTQQQTNFNVPLDGAYTLRLSSRAETIYKCAPD